jgi:hypothetical protein
MSDYPPSVPLCRLYERTSRKGTHYLTGRLGAAKIVVLKSSETTDDGTPIWNVLMQEAPPKQSADAQTKPRERQVSGDAGRGWQRPLDDTIPF